MLVVLVLVISAARAVCHTSCLLRVLTGSLLFNSVNVNDNQASAWFKAKNKLLVRQAQE